MSDKSRSLPTESSFLTLVLTVQCIRSQGKTDRLTHIETKIIQTRFQSSKRLDQKFLMTAHRHCTFRRVLILLLSHSALFGFTTRHFAPDSWQHFQTPEKQRLPLSVPPRLTLQLLVKAKRQVSSVFLQNFQPTCSFSKFQSPKHRTVYMNATYILITIIKSRKNTNMWTYSVH